MSSSKVTQSVVTTIPFVLTIGHTSWDLGRTEGGAEWLRRLHEKRAILYRWRGGIKV